MKENSERIINAIKGSTERAKKRTVGQVSESSDGK